MNSLTRKCSLLFAAAFTLASLGLVACDKGGAAGGDAPKAGATSAPAGDKKMEKKDGDKMEKKDGDKMEKKADEKK